MENIWTKINDDIPLYMKHICNQYNLACAKISQLQTALVGKDFALVIGVDRFYAEVSYLHKNGRGVKVYYCDNYFAEKFDADDRVNLLDGEGANYIVRNELIIIANGLLNKWSSVLEGDTGWIKDYKKSKWYFVRKLPKTSLYNLFR